MSNTQEQTVRAYLAQHAPELLDALGGVYAWAKPYHRGDWKPPIRILLDAIEAAGLLDRPQHDPLPAMMLGAEAFGEEGA